MRSPTRASTTGASASMKNPGRMPATRQSAEHRREREPVGFARALGRGRAGAAEKSHTERLDEAGCGKRRRECKKCAHRRHQELEAPGGKLRAEQDRLEGQPFGDEAVERRQCRDRRAADEKNESR